MTVDVTMLTYGRPALTEQALKTLEDNTPADLYHLYTLSEESGAGIARNHLLQGIPREQRGDLLAILDNDVFLTPHWLEVMLEAWEVASSNSFDIIGGFCHPYNAAPLHTIPVYSTHLNRTVEIREVVALATQSWLLRWETYDTYGPFREAPGINQSEDVHFCNLVRANGKKVGYVWPHVVLPSGLTDTYGKPAVGAELLTPQDGVVME